MAIKHGELSSQLACQQWVHFTESCAYSTVGQQVISQKISALENWRLNHHHLYKEDPQGTDQPPTRQSHTQN